MVSRDSQFQILDHQGVVVTRGKGQLQSLDKGRALGRIRLVLKLAQLPLN